MRKHKSVVAILLAVMMIFTFMPTMAFADIASYSSDWSFSDDYSQLISSDGTQKYDTVKVWDEDEGNVIVMLNEAKYGDLDADDFPIMRYFDLSGSKFATGSYRDLAEIYNAGFTSASVTALKLVAPADVTVPSGDDNYAYVTLDEIKAATHDKWAGSFALNEDYVVNSKEDQTVTISLKQSWSETPAPGSYEAIVKGAPVAATTTVLGAAAAPTEAKFYLDKAVKTADETETNTVDYINQGRTLTVPYDGKEHTVVMGSLKGYSATYKVFNSSTGNWDSVDAVTVKDYQASKIQVEATVADTATGKKTQTYSFYVNVSKVVVPTFSFIEHYSNRYYLGRYPEYTVTDGYDLFDYVEVVPSSYNKAAVAADAETWEAFKKEMFTITETADKIDATMITAKLGFVDAEKVEEVLKKYEALLNNYILPTSDTFDYDDLIGIDTAYVTYVAGLDPTDASLATEVEFTNSPTVKSYSYKKVLKKKSKSFTVKATADNGAVVNYKLINAPAKIVIDKTTGKITLKKKLAKGTYKIKVKAYVKGNSKVAETHAITIKVKK